MNYYGVRSIRFENVTFSYPKTDKKVLDNISFEINENEEVSIVVLNGAGKSTVVKLICRLYHPDSGTIYISHRMSSSVFCDRILVLNNSTIEAYDSHKNLMENKEGLYYKLFNSQATNYKLETQLGYQLPT